MIFPKVIKSPENIEDSAKKIQIHPLSDIGIEMNSLKPQIVEKKTVKKIKNPVIKGMLLTKLKKNKPIYE